MNPREKDGWVTFLWPFSLGAMVWLGTCFGSGEFNISFAILVPIITIVVAIAWLFRITYVMGSRRR